MHTVGTHNRIHPSPLHPAFGTQLAPVAAHSHQLPQRSAQAGGHADHSSAAPEQSVLQSEATGGMSQYGREARSPPAGSQATDFSRFSLTALPSSRK